MESKIEHDGVRLRNYRVMKNITLTKAATLCGVSKSELSKLESGARPVRPDHVIKLAGAYGITPLDLLTPDSKLRAFVERVADVQCNQRDLPLYDGKTLSSLKESARPCEGKRAPLRQGPVPDPACRRARRLCRQHQRHVKRTGLAARHRSACSSQAPGRDQ